MNVIFEYTNVSASERIENFAKDKLQALENKFPFIIRADVFLKKENVSEDANQSCGIRLSVPGPRLYASETSESFESAITKAIEELKVQLEKKKSNYNNFSLN